MAMLSLTAYVREQTVQCAVCASSGVAGIQAHPNTALIFKKNGLVTESLQLWFCALDSGFETLISSEERNIQICLNHSTVE
jgi:hypothetical protein